MIPPHIRRVLRDWSEAITLAVTTVAVVAAVVATVVAIGTSGAATRSAKDATAAADRAAATLRAQKRSDDRAVERDAARTFQRCEQIEPVAIVAQLGLDAAPGLRAKVLRDRPGLLDENGHLPVPDCRRIYPFGASVSPRYPDLTPTKPAP